MRVRYGTWCLGDAFDRDVFLWAMCLVWSRHRHALFWLSLGEHHGPNLAPNLAWIASRSFYLKLPAGREDDGKEYLCVMLPYIDYVNHVNKDTKLKVRWVRMGR